MTKVRTVLECLHNVRALIKNHPEAAIEEIEELIAYLRELNSPLKIAQIGSLDENLIKRLRAACSYDELACDVLEAIDHN